MFFSPPLYSKMQIMNNICLLSNLFLLYLYMYFLSSYVSVILSGVDKPLEMWFWGFHVFPCYATVFNDNMVAQAVAGPTRQKEEEVKSTAGAD